MFELLAQAFEIYSRGGDDALMKWYENLSPEQKRIYTHEVSASSVFLKKGLEAAKEYFQRWREISENLNKALQ